VHEQEHPLRHVLRVGRIASDQHQVTYQRNLDAPEQMVEGLPISGLGAENQQILFAAIGETARDPFNL
jgi:hypothetical protein